MAGQLATASSKQTNTLQRGTTRRTTNDRSGQNVLRSIGWLVRRVRPVGDLCVAITSSTLPFELPALACMCKMFQQTQHHSYALPVEAVRGQVRIRMKCPKCKKKIMWGVLVFGGRTFLQAAIHRSTPPLDLTHPSITVRIGDVVGTSALPCANIGVCDH